MNGNMEKIVAILTQRGALSKGLHEDTMVNLFKMNNEKVMGVENVPLEETTNTYFSLMMALREVSLIYVDTISHDLKRLLEKLGIKTKCKNEVANDRFLEQFIFD